MDNAINVPFEYDDLIRPQETRTYAMDFRHKRIIGHTDDKDAVLQAIWKILSTRRFAHLLYDDQYGFDIMNKINSGLTRQYLDSDIPKMVEEALLVDERVIGISDFQYEIKDKDSIYVEFIVSTIYGDERIKGVIRDSGYKY